MKVLVLVLIIIGFFGVFLLAFKFYLENIRTFPKVEQKEGQLVSGFPDFPSYPNAQITSSQKNYPAEDYSFSYQAYLTSKDSPQEILEWYKTNLQGKKWTLTRDIDTSDAEDENIVVQKGNLTATINAEREGDENTTISIFVIQK